MSPRGGGPGQPKSAGGSDSGSTGQHERPKHARAAEARASLRAHLAGHAQVLSSPHSHHHDHAHGHDHDHAHSHSHAHDHVHREDQASSFFEVLDDSPERPLLSLTGPACLHVDPISGAAGDMLCGALLDLGVPLAQLLASVNAMGLANVEVAAKGKVDKSIGACVFSVRDLGAQPSRDYRTIRDLLARAPLAARVRELAERAFLRLAEAEARVHRAPIDHVHFHEVGGVDAIVDIVGACAGLAHLEGLAGGIGALRISLNPLPVGSGRIRGSHGPMPVPAPATLELLCGLPVCDPRFPDGFHAELVTPTGAALLRAWLELLPSQHGLAAPANVVGRWPTFQPHRIGYGAGTRSMPDRPNVLRLVLGYALAQERPTATHVVLEANIDDATGEIAAAVIGALMADGALDAWASPITMKKGRPALLLGAIARAADADRLTQRMLAESTTLGVRRSEVSRVERPRRFVAVDTRYGSVRVKIADGDGLAPVLHPEFDECAARASEQHVPVREVVRAAMVAASALVLTKPQE